MTSFWAAIQATDIAVWINLSRWGYAAISTVHVLGIATLLGSMLVLDLRLLGLGRSVDPHRLAGFVVPVAATGLVIAILSGALMFSGRASEYAAFETFQVKMALLASAIALILVAHLRFGFRFDRATHRQQAAIGAISLVFWLCIAVSGRMIAFVHG